VLRAVDRVPERFQNITKTFPDENAWTRRKKPLVDSLAGEMKRVSGKYVATFARILHVLLSRGGVSVFGHALDPRRHNDGLSEAAEHSIPAGARRGCREGKAPSVPQPDRFA
jgi:hypothetical protein